MSVCLFFFFSSRRRHTRCSRDWSSDVCSSDLKGARERYSKHVKAVFQVGRDRSDGFNVTLGYPAEIVPLDNPYGMDRGAALRVRCLMRSEEHTSELQSRLHLVCRLLLEKKKTQNDFTS